MRLMRSKNLIIVLLTLGFVLTTFFFAEPAQAIDWAKVVALPFSYTFAILVYAIGAILSVLMYILIWVAGYNDFINADAVNTGWVIVRDLCNMFFILILLVIAFATTLNRESYSMKRLLPKFILAAIFINFSKLICGVIIDFAQVIMLTFVNGFRDIGPGNLTAMLGINELLDINKASPDEANVMTIIGSYVLAFLYVLIATVVIIVILFILIMRIVMLWIYIVLSPLAYLLMVLPATEKYAKQWWDQFVQNVVSGPVLAFFIWLSFAAVSITSTGSSILSDTPQPNQTENESSRFGALSAPQAGLSQAGTPDGMLKILISIGLLMGGLMVTKQIGGIAGSIAGGGLDKIKKGAQGVKNWATNPVTGRLKAFQSERESARNAKYQSFGQGMYGNYLAAKGAVRGALKIGGSKTAAGIGQAGKGLLSVTVGKEKTDKITQAIERGFAKAKSVKDVLTMKDFRESRKQRDDINNRRRKAYQDENGVYKDGAGQEFNLIDNQGRYYRDKIRTDDKGKAINKKDEHGNDIADQFETEQDYAKESWGGVDRYVTKMDDKEYKTSNIWASSMKDSWAYKNKKEEQDVSKEQEKLSNAGLTSEQLLQMLKDDKSSERTKLAASLTLAIKEGFVNHGQVKEAERFLGKTNNSLLSKKFNDDVDKKQAYLHYDMKTEAGRKQFEKRLADGKVETQQPDAYKQKEVIQAYSNTFTDKEFIRKMEQIGASTNKHNESLKAGTRSYLDFQEPAFNDKDELDKSRKVIKKITGDMNDTVRGHSDNADMVKKILKEAFMSMSTAEAAKLDVSTFTPNKDLFKSDNEKDMYLRSLREAIRESFEPDQIENIIKDRNGNRKTQQEFRNLMGQFAPPINRRRADAGDEEDEEE